MSTTHKHISPVVLESPENPAPHGGTTQLGQHHMHTSWWRQYLTHHARSSAGRNILQFMSHKWLKNLHISGLINNCLNLRRPDLLFLDPLSLLSLVAVH